MFRQNVFYIHIGGLHVILFFSPNNSYMMMLNCWEAVPDKRPTFKTLYTNASKIIEGIAGYLEMGFNPFTAKNTTGEDEKRCRSTE